MDPMDLGTFLKRARINSSMTLREVEEKINISNSYLSQIENNKIKNPSPRILYELSEIYNLEYDALLELAGYPSTNTLNRQKEPSYRRGSILNNLSQEEEMQLSEYLQFLRSKRKR